MRNLVLAAAVAATAFAAPAMAQTVTSPQWYGTLGVTQFDHSEGDLAAVTGRVGAKFNRYIGVEGEASVGVKDDTFFAGAARGSLEHQYDAAAYVVGTVPVTQNLELFARGGYGTTKIKAELDGASFTADGESWNYGAGANYNFDAQNGVRADWTRRDFRDDAGEADVYSVSYVRRF